MELVLLILVKIYNIVSSYKTVDCFQFIPETYAPVILKRKAERLVFFPEYHSFIVYVLELLECASMMVWML